MPSFQQNFLFLFVILRREWTTVQSISILKKIWNFWKSLKIAFFTFFEGLKNGLLKKKKLKHVLDPRWTIVLNLLQFSNISPSGYWFFPPFQFSQIFSNSVRFRYVKPLSAQKSMLAHLHKSSLETIFFIFLFDLQSNHHPFFSNVENGPLIIKILNKIWNYKSMFHKFISHAPSKDKFIFSSPLLRWNFTPGHHNRLPTAYNTTSGPRPRVQNSLK